MLRKVGVVLLVLAGYCPGATEAPAADPLPGTSRLTWQDDISLRLVRGVDAFLGRKITAAVDERSGFWNRDFSSPANYAASLRSQRQRLSRILGVVDDRPAVVEMELLATVERPALVGRGRDYEVFAVRWPALPGIHGEGLLLVPTQGEAVADIVAIPDAGQTPEQLAGLEDGTPVASQFARSLAERGCRVIVPTLVDRHLETRSHRNKRISNREFVYRGAYELGRHLIGYEVQKVLAAVDWLTAHPSAQPHRIGLAGWGEGGLLALYAAALDPRPAAVLVSGYFDCRDELWREPIERNVFGLLRQFGDAEIASLILPRHLVIEAAAGPQVDLPSEGGAPGRLRTPDVIRVRAEVERLRRLCPPWRDSVHLVESADGSGMPGTRDALRSLLRGLGVTSSSEPEKATGPEKLAAVWPTAARQQRIVEELNRFNQWLLEESPYVRQRFMENLYTQQPGLIPLDEYAQRAEWYRDYFRDEVIGAFSDRLLAPHPRTRLAYDEKTWTGYEVVLDVFPEVIAYGILLVPRNMQPQERRPVVVCQHGLEGRPQDVIAGNHRAYHNFAAQLAERGFIVFAPQNLYLGQDEFRALQRKANPLQKTLFSIMVPQHEQIVRWLATLPQVDPHRIAFYGLSYGGKSAMRIPPLVRGYCLSICSGDFNDWIWKNVSTRSPYSYMGTGEYEMFEFDLGSTFSYAEMAALIAPRPFMVERGHHDGVAPDERVALEFAKVRFLYAAKLGLPDHCRIEWFRGVHEIHATGTFAFLHEHLSWPSP